VRSVLSRVMAGECQQTPERRRSSAALTRGGTRARCD
jgi:hypothetical protein